MGQIYVLNTDEDIAYFLQYRKIDRYLIEETHHNLIYGSMPISFHSKQNESNLRVWSYMY